MEILCIQQKFLLQDQEGEFGSCCSELKIGGSSVLKVSLLVDCLGGVWGEGELPPRRRRGRQTLYVASACISITEQEEAVGMGVAVIRELGEQDLIPGLCSSECSSAQPHQLLQQHNSARVQEP